jgi:spermidine synthase
LLDFEELGFEDTPIGELSLRRRSEPRLGGTSVFEVKLGGDYLMSSLFTDGEVALAQLGLDALGRPDAEVVIGGLGLGYTAARALEHPHLGSLVVIEAFGAVIEWHRRELVPVSPAIARDPRCRMLCADFFALAADPQTGFDHDRLGRRFDAVLLDIDHSPQALLVDGTREFYSPQGLKTLQKHLKPGGVFALWSDDPPDAAFETNLRTTFTRTHSHVVSFDNPYTGEISTNTVYVAS